ncbi:YhcN/YlaJ family sporulation lipoprotein [Neobacillus sp. OS1-2]|uniref:YhcN/YlaJ family sporulation lipoprotein n=1 Tax=Neobacillus sp. OS1-2 TaxID=3070680 RepID=UPI0027E159FD|nr:YhcN/YlaJ family sporulation lipoprotein [Neobacillus sp. OS1-2]WML40692.1 YhcN/YlaJ family sporulation lipoprotein [Neobacillus sp. OS1-2]
MNKKQWMIPLSAFFLIGAAGCASDNNRAGVNEKNNLARPIGYYSNENHPNNGNELIRDNDGAITEMMDHTLGDEDQVINEENSRQIQTRDENGNPKNPTTPLAKKDRNFFQRDNRFSTSDMNYHGHLSTNMGNTGVATNPNFQDDFSNKIRNKVAAIHNVQDVRSVAYGNTVIVSVKLQDNSKAADTKRAIKNAVKPYAKGREVTVFTDEGAIGRDRNTENDIQRNKGGR